MSQSSLTLSSAVSRDNAFSYRGQASSFSKSGEFSAAKQQASIALAKKSLVSTGYYSINTETISDADKTARINRGNKP